jgi:hypothetical protein
VDGESNPALTASNGRSNQGGTTNGTRVRRYVCNGTASQQ